MINEVDGLLSDRVTPPIVAEHLVSQGDSLVPLDIRRVLSSPDRPLKV